MDVVGLLNNINDKSDMFAVKTWTAEWSNNFQENQVSFNIDFYSFRHLKSIHNIRSDFVFKTLSKTTLPVLGNYLFNFRNQYP